VAPVAILIVPILDTTLVTLARLRRGQRPWHGSPDHFAVRLRRHGWSPNQVALYACGLGAIGGSIGVALTFASQAAALALAACTGLLLLGNLAWLWRLDPTRGAQPATTELRSVSSA
jgi:UDP-GlcNAc:undecaprenyl-phosphate GlcNAc-1-phosphate transferase